VFNYDELLLHQNRFLLGCLNNFIISLALPSCCRTSRPWFILRSCGDQ